MGYEKKGSSEGGGKMAPFSEDDEYKNKRNGSDVHGPQ